MSIRLRVFIVDRDDRVRRFSSSRFGRLHERDSHEALVGFDNEWVRFAEVAVELENRNPVRVVRALFVRIRVGPDGRPDAKEMDDQFRLSVGVIEPTWTGDPEIIIGRSYWAKKKLRDRHRWEPSPFLERKIRQLALVQ
jgi:hypothetical protein